MSHKAESPEQIAQEASQGNPIYRMDLNGEKPVLNRYMGAEHAIGVLTEGPEGWCQASFADGDIDTEIPNLLLAAKTTLDAAGVKEKKKPAAKKQSKKKKAAKTSTDEYGDEQMTYTMMWYKNSTTVGIRQGKGEKRQILSFGGAKTSKSRAQLESIGKLCIKKLLGEGEGAIESIRQWAKAEAAGK